MTAAEELLLERLCKVDPTIPYTFLKYQHQLNIEDYNRFEHVLKTEESSNYELRIAIFRILDAKLIEFDLDPELEEAIDGCHDLNVKLFPVCIICISLYSIIAGSNNCFPSSSAPTETW